jgi:hypothetical protein
MDVEGALGSASDLEAFGGRGGFVLELVMFTREMRGDPVRGPIPHSKFNLL